MDRGIPIELTQEARKAVRKAVLDFIQENGHREYKFSDIAAMTGYPTSSIACFIRNYMSEDYQPKSKVPKRKALLMEKPEFVRDVEKTTGLHAFPYKHNTSRPEWRLMSPKGILLMVLIGEDDLLHAARLTKSLSALQGIPYAEREKRKTKRHRRRREKEEQDITELTDKLWENDE